MKNLNQIKNIIVAFVLTISINATAQQIAKVNNGSTNYKNAIGLRFGETSGITFKHMFGNSNAFEGIVSIWPYNLGLTGLLEKNLSTGVSSLNFYYGAGAHANFGSSRYRVYYWDRDREYTYVYSTSAIALGIDGILGLEYKFKPIPLAISADIKPYVEVGNYDYSYFTLDPSIGIKLTF